MATQTMASCPPLPPFTRESAIQKVRLAEDGWNSRDPAKVALAYTIPWAGHVGVSPAPALVLRVPVHAEWHRVRCRAGHRRRLALLAASPDRSAQRAQDVSILPGVSLR